MQLPRIALPVLAILPVAMAASPWKQVIVSFEGNVPQEVVDKAKQACVDAGGHIDHIYTLLT
jgi:hypothetical protein